MNVVNKEARLDKVSPMCLEAPVQKKKTIGLTKGSFIAITITAIIFAAMINGPDNPSILAPFTDLLDKSGSLRYSVNNIDLVATIDGGLAFICQVKTDPYPSGDKIKIYGSNIDKLLVKTNSSGMIEWSKSLAKIVSDFHFYHLVQALDGGYFLTGDYKNADLCLLKTDTKGNALWNATYRMPSNDDQYSIITDLILLQDGGLAMVGASGPYIHRYYHEMVPFLMKIDENGKHMWNQSFHSYQEINALVQTDNGFTLIGSKENSLVLINTDENGEILWDKKYEGISGLESNKIVLTQDKGFVFAGGGNDITLLIKTDGTGEQIWTKEFSFSLYDLDSMGFVPADFFKLNIIETDKGNIVLSGYERPSKDCINTRLIKTTADGKIKWNQRYSGGFSSIVETSEGDYTLAGLINIKENQVETCLLTINPEGDVIWKRVYSGSVNEEWANCIIQTNDGGIAFTGVTTSYGIGKSDMWLVKTDANGQVEWNKTYGNERDDEGIYLFQETNGDFTLIGGTSSTGETLNGHPVLELFIIKVDEAGTLLWNKTYCKGFTTHNDPRTLYSFQTIDGGVICALLGYSGMWMVKIDRNGEIQWDQSFTNFGNWIYQTSDSGYLFIAEWEQDNSLIKLNSYGNIEWTLEWTEFLINYPFYHLQPTPDNGCVCMAITRNWAFEWEEELGSVNNVQLVKIDANGTTEWTQSFDEIAFTSYVAAFYSFYHQTPDDGYICVLADSSSRYLVKVDIDGEITWTKQYGSMGSLGSIETMYITQENEYLLLKSKYILMDNAYRLEKYILEKVNTQGVTQWTQDFSMGSKPGVGTGGTTTFYMSQTKDRDIFLAGPTSTNENFFLLKIDIETGNVLLNYTLPECYFGNFYEAFPYYFDTNNTESILIAITNRIPSWGSEYKWLLNIHQNGTLLWNYASYPFYFNSIISTEDDGYVLGGLVWNFPGMFGVSRDAFVMKLDENLSIEWTQTYGSSCTRISCSYLINETVFIIATSESSSQSSISESPSRNSNRTFWREQGIWGILAMSFGMALVVILKRFENKP
ncbi:MAG: hypothetical protein ACFFAE_19330 [Candidatus Hodarchaeota archaeon]